MVKDEKYYDAYDNVFDNFFSGAMHETEDLFARVVPEDWLRALAERTFDPEELARLEKLSFEALMEELAKRLQEQRGPPSGRQSLDRHRRHLAIRQ